MHLPWLLAAIAVKIAVYIFVVLINLFTSQVNNFIIISLHTIFVNVKIRCAVASFFLVFIVIRQGEDVDGVEQKLMNVWAKVRVQLKISGI